MTIRHRHSIRTRALRTHSLVFVAALISLRACGCVGLFPFGECFPPGNEASLLRLHGNVVNAETIDGVNGAAVSATLITGGEEITRDRSSLLTAEDGAFEIPLTAKGPQCVTPPDLPRPDQVEVIVVLDGCGQTFVIDINEDTVVDLDFPDRVIELKEPILVSDCG